MLGLGLSNKYRYDHLVSKLDLFYDFDKIKIAMNLPGRDKIKVSENYSKLYLFLSDYILNYLRDV